MQKQCKKRRCAHTLVIRNPNTRKKRRSGSILKLHMQKHRKKRRCAHTLVIRNLNTRKKRRSGSILKLHMQKHRKKRRCAHILVIRNLNTRKKRRSGSILKLHMLALPSRIGLETMPPQKVLKICCFCNDFSNWIDVCILNLILERFSFNHGLPSFYELLFSMFF